MQAKWKVHVLFMLTDRLLKYVDRIGIPPSVGRDSARTDRCGVPGAAFKPPPTIQGDYKVQRGYKVLLNVRLVIHMLIGIQFTVGNTS